MLKIQFINGAEYEMPMPSIGLWRKLIKFQSGNTDIMTDDGFDNAQNLIIEAFGKQFTKEEMEAPDGLPLGDWLEILTGVAEKINELVSTKKAEIPDSGKK